MFKKSFVSIYFLQDKLIILQLFSNKRKVKRHASVDLPKGLIRNFRVTNPDALAQILNGIWSKFHIKDKAVGIILPEFSTFTKIVKIPRLGAQELDEAVRWQAQEYLPDLSNTVLDWKIVDRLNENIEILLVAVDADILTEYLQAVEGAGLFPLVVEIPSTCLARLSSEKEKPVLTLYKNFSETLLVVSEKEKIIGTSVLRDGSTDEVIKTAEKMLSHFKDAKVQKVLVSGGEVTKELIQGVTHALKIEAELLSPKVEGLDPNQAQDYLIPLSMQFVEPQVPKDPTSLNLMPARLVEKYRHEALKLQVWGLTLTVTLFVWISFLVVMGAYLLMGQNINQLKSKNAGMTQVSQRREATVKDVQAINSVSDKVVKIKKVTVPVQKVLNDIERAKGAGVRIESYELDFDTGQVLVSGIAASRTSLVEFKQNLESNPDIASVNIPISSFEKEVNLEFNLSFAYLPAGVSETKKRPIQDTLN